MNTPIYDFLKKYAQSGTLRCHMPAHKGKSPAPELSAMYALDITEISGADSLFEADGIIAQSEKNMSGLYGTAGTVYSAGGSTLCIQTMLYIMKCEKRKIFAVRNVHRAFLNAVALLDIDVEWILPEYSGSILSGNINLSDIENALKNSPEPSALYVTSPDYTGKTADISALVGICRKYNARLIVDNAHGTHLKFMPEDFHPITLGADMCCDSAHKMFPALTGSAMLHTSVPEYVPLLKQAMNMFGSTSPSYLIMMSLDLCNKYISEKIRSDIENNLIYIENLRKKFSDRLLFAEGEPFHITVKASESGYDGNELAELLRKNGVECEYSDSSLIILLMSPVCTKHDYEKLTDALTVSVTECRKIKPYTVDFCMKLPGRVMSIHKAVFSECETIAVEESEGRICASVKVPCPPAVPVVASGERIDRNSINIFLKYGISDVIVVK
ncbi:MAG: aminotransferase class I/II-fold pyridoxal phosphate-dependent enzyme [Ruminococcus flavefaciens]|nr:aminotransferase class I/II-fold pyridoxal phosphate-dependent enzyme [Ruminococcus flavefaciens]